LKPFNSSLSRDITKLKLLHAKKDKTDFNSMKNEIMLKHSISKATVYREMKKETPGLYKKPNYNPPHRPVTEKEIRLVAELLIKGRSVQDITRLMQKRTGDKYSWDRITQIRKIIDQRLDRKTAADTAEEPNETLNNETLSNETAFGDKLREFIETLFDLDNISPGVKLTARIEDTVVSLGYNDIKDIALVIANASAAGTTSQLTLMKRRIFHLLSQKLRLSSAGAAYGVSFKEIAEISRIYREYEKDELAGFSPDYRVLVSVVTHLMPRVSYDEILELAKNYHDRINGSTREIVPYEAWLREQSDFAPFTELFRGLTHAMEEGTAVITDAEKVFPYIKDNFAQFVNAYEALYELYLGKERMDFLRERGLEPNLHERVMSTIRAKQAGRNQDGSNYDIENFNTENFNSDDFSIATNPDRW
jgi:hypothetical protein